MGIRKSIYLATVIVVLTLGLIRPVPISSLPNSLWIGNDSYSTPPSHSALNTDLSGKVLRTLDVPAIGFAIDPNSDTIYWNGYSAGIQPRSLTTLELMGDGFVPPQFAEDLTFDGTHVVTTSLLGHTIYKINPATGEVVSSFDVPFQSVGIAWDGSCFWISEWTSPRGTGNAVYRYTADGVFTGQKFVPFADDTVGGLAFDNTDKTLYVGTFGRVVHFTTDGTWLGEFSTGDDRYVDGLEFQPAIANPEPICLTLLGLGTLGLLGYARWRNGPRKSAWSA